MNNIREEITAENISYFSKAQNLFELLSHFAQFLQKKKRVEQNDRQLTQKDLVFLHIRP